MSQTIIESVKDFIAQCPHIDILKGLKVDFLSGNDRGYSIEAEPTETIITTYVDGSTERKFVFTFACKFEWNEEAENNIDNCGFFEKFQEWLEEQTENENLPILPAGMEAWKIEATSSGYLYAIENSNRYARYQCQCSLYYDKE